MASVSVNGIECAYEKVAPLPAARALHRGIAGSRLQVIPSAGHQPFLEQPAAFNAALMEFVGSV